MFKLSRFDWVQQVGNWQPGQRSGLHLELWALKLACHARSKPASMPTCQDQGFGAIKSLRGEVIEVVGVSGGRCLFSATRLPSD